MARIHDGAIESLRLRPDVVTMLAAFTSDFDVTWAQRMTLYGAEVFAILLRPEKHIRGGFGLENEILLVHHQYSSIQPRVLHIAERILSESPCQGRAEPMAFMLLTAAADSKNQVKRLAADSNNPRVIIPFEESECRRTNDAYFVRNRLAEFFYSRDLFDMSRPLASDLYFFGRHAFVLSLRDLLKSGENLGLFGLRRTGKTSVLFRLQRLLQEDGAGRLIYFDLEDSALYQLRWWELLERIARSLPSGKSETGYTEANAAEKFRQLLARMGKSKVVVALDEIEHITPGERLRMREHWDQDFVELWKTLRAVQNTNRHVSFVVCGTNAAPVESAQFADRDNPLFGMVTKKYMPSFSADEVRQMVRTLGRFMGLTFREDCFPYLHERYGGHPHLTRQACSKLFEDYKAQKKPVEITLGTLQGGENERDLALFSNAENVLSVLQRWYPFEYEMLDYLARDDVDKYLSVEATLPDLSAHLRAYGLVKGSPPVLSMQFIASYLRSKAAAIAAAQVTGPAEETPEAESELFQRLATLGFHRNRLELKLRRFIKRTFLIAKGPARWIDPILLSVPTERREKLAGVDKDEILKNNLFLLDLLGVVVKNWASFIHLEQQAGQARVTKAQFEVLVDFLNRHREDAHAKDVDEATVAAVGLAAGTIEQAIDPYLVD